MKAKDRIQGKAFIIVTHKFVSLPTDDLKDYLVSNSATVLYIWHSFSDAKDRKSFYEFYEHGKLKKSNETRDYKFLPEALVYLKEMFYSFMWILFSQYKWDVYIGADGLCSLIGILCRRIGRVRKAVYWAIDFVPKDRFDNKIANALYRTMNNYSLMHVDQAWNLSPRMAEGRTKLYGKKSKRFAQQFVVPLGVWTERRRMKSIDDTNKHTLVFMGHLLEKQGVQLVLEAIPRIKKAIPGFKFVVIGTGKYESALKRKARELSVQKEVRFVGFIEEHRELEQELSRYACAVAPYNERLDTWTYYADPGKVKNYLASGLPVVITDVPYIAQELVKERCGVVVQYDPLSLSSAVIELLTNETLLREYRENAFRLSKRYDWDRIFGDTLDRLVLERRDLVKTRES